jgi:hypothetical protein
VREGSRVRTRSGCGQRAWLRRSAATPLREDRVAWAGAGSQEAVTDAIRTWAEAVQSITPSLPTPPIPFADKLPKPSELVPNAYDFAEQLLAAQRKFAEDLMAATTPVLTAKDDTTAKKAGS